MRHVKPWRQSPHAVMDMAPDPAVVLPRGQGVHGRLEEKLE